MASSSPNAISIQPMDVTSLRAVLKELRTQLLPSRFEKAQQSRPHTVQLGFRGLEGQQWLECSWMAEAPRLLAIDPPPRQGQGSTLALQLQHGLRGLALVGIAQHGWERVVELEFAPRPGAAVERTLLLELMGRHSNLFLLDGERRVTALARQVRTNQSRLRPIGTGDPYQPPPGLTGEPPRLEEPFTAWRRRLNLLPLPLGEALMDAYQGVSPALARQLGGDRLAAPVEALREDDWMDLWSRWRAWLTASEEGSFQLQWEGEHGYRCWLGPGTAGPGSASDSDPMMINHGLAAYYGKRLAARELLARRQGLRQRLEAAAAREERLEADQQNLLAGVPASEALQRQADALLSGLQPDREQIAEAQRLYRKARKLRRSKAAILPRLDWHQQRRSWIAASLTYLEQAENLEELQALEADLAELSPPQGEKRTGAGRPGPAKASPSSPQPLEIHTDTGLRVQVGRNHRQNEWISLRQARRGDLWFHAQECPGSHVVLKGSEQVPEDGDVQLAADLAAHFSRARGNARVPVVMVRAETLQRIPGAGCGTVRHPGGEVIWARPERVASLLPTASSLSVTPEPGP